MRKIRQIKPSNKAISPIIAVLLLVAIAVVSSLVAYAWIMGYIGGSTTKTSNAIQIQSSLAEETWLFMSKTLVKEPCISARTVASTLTAPLKTFSDATGRMLLKERLSR